MTLLAGRWGGWGGVRHSVFFNSCFTSVPKRNLLRLDPIKNITYVGGVHRAVPLTRLNGEVLRETQFNCPRRSGLEITIHTKKNTDNSTYLRILLMKSTIR